MLRSKFVVRKDDSSGHWSPSILSGIARIETSEGLMVVSSAPLSWYIRVVVVVGSEKGWYVVIDIEEEGCDISVCGGAVVVICESWREESV
jgi:hypothetical protein